MLQGRQWAQVANQWSYYTCAAVISLRMIEETSDVMCVSCLSSISVAISFHPFHSRFLTRCTLVHSAHKMHII